MKQPRGVSFDFGQTLAELDSAMLAAKCATRGLHVAEPALERAAPAAFQAYDAAVASAAGRGGHPWKLLVTTLLDGALQGQVDEREVAAVVDFLWDDQPRKNLWRRPIAGMLELVRALRAGGAPVVIVSNSEGRLSELVAQLGWTADFDAVADSGVVGVEKPDPRIFDWAAERVGLRADELVHVGDSLAADVGGALAAGATAVWLRGRWLPGSPPVGVHVCDDASSLGRVLDSLGLPGVPPR